MDKRGMKYKTLNDCPLFPVGEDVEIWYARLYSFLIMVISKDNVFNPDKIGDTHDLLGTLKSLSGIESGGADELATLYRNLQGEIWSPKGEASDLIRSKGLSHTSMSVGDIIRFKNGTMYMVSPIGWDRYDPKDFKPYTETANH